MDLSAIAVIAAIAAAIFVSICILQNNAGSSYCRRIRHHFAG